MSDAPDWLTELAEGSLDDVNEVAGEILLLTSGHLVACDPLVFLSGAEPFARAVRPGKYEVRIGKRGSDTVYARVKLGRGKVVKWEVARCPGEDDVEGWPGYGVDSGTGCFVDLEAVRRFVEEEDELSDAVSVKVAEEGVDASDVLTYHEAFEKHRAALGGVDPIATIEPALRKNHTAVAIRLTKKSDANLVAFSAGVGDGVYASFWGLDKAGEPQVLMTDFGLLEPEEGDDADDLEDSDLEDSFDDTDAGDIGSDIEALAAALGAELEPDLETRQEPSPLFRQSRDLLKRWIADEKLELEPGVNVDAFAEKLLEKLASLSGARNPGSRLAEWLLDRHEVADVFASDDDFEKDLTPG